MAINASPGSVTELTSINLKREAFEKWRTGYASAYAIILLASTIDFVLIMMKWFKVKLGEIAR